MQLSLAKGQTVQFESPLLILSANAMRVQASLERWQHGREDFKGTDELKGLGKYEAMATEKNPELKYDHFMAYVPSSMAPQEYVSLQLPSVMVNGKRLTPHPIEFHRVVKTAVYACVQ